MHDAATELQEWFFFDATEHSLVTRAMQHLHGAAPSQAEHLAAQLHRLRTLATVVRDCGPVANAWRALRGEAPGESLTEMLARVPHYDFELHIPTKAVVGGAYLVAKINLLKAIGYALGATQGPVALRDAVEAEVGQSIYSKIVEELLVAIATDRAHDDTLKRRAAEILLRIWDERLLSEIDDIAPLLEAAWQARDRVRPVLGTMLGTHEIFTLFQAARDDRFLDYYTGEGAVSDDETAAFEEFLFGLSYEDITTLRTHLRVEGLSAISPDDARKVLGAGVDIWGFDAVGAQAVYTHYRRRRMFAECRALTARVGPKKVAEEYVLVSYLTRGAALTLRDER
jgi:hypothetical protein